MKWEKKSLSFFFKQKKKQTPILTKGTEDLNIKFSIEDMQMATGT